MATLAEHIRKKSVLFEKLGLRKGIVKNHQKSKLDTKSINE
jgi:hypothetical protein